MSNATLSPAETSPITYTTALRSNKFLGRRNVLSFGTRVIATFPADIDGEDACALALRGCLAATTPEERRAAERLADVSADTFR